MGQILECYFVISYFPRPISPAGPSFEDLGPSLGVDPRVRILTAQVDSTSGQQKWTA